MRGLDPRIHDDRPQMKTLHALAVAGHHHGLHQNSGLPEFCIN
jgi:hypothetical protein